MFETVNHEWAPNDIVMFDKNVYQTPRNWFGYIFDTKISHGQIGVRWWDDELFMWTAPQNIPIGALIFIGRADV